MGGAMLRDFAIVSTAMGVSFSVIKKTGFMGVLSLMLGIGLSFLSGAIIAVSMGYYDAKSITTIGAGACTFVVGPVWCGSGGEFGCHRYQHCGRRYKIYLGHYCNAFNGTICRLK